MERNFDVYVIKDWESIAEEILPLLQFKILLLKGNLGVGKTTFTKKLLSKIGTNDEVESPTYSLVNEYHTAKGIIFHFDLYRVNSIEELYDIGIEEYLETGFLSIIEWPEIYEEELLGLEYHIIEIENIGKLRKVKFY